MCALGSSNFYIDSGSEVTWLVSLNLFNLQVAFFSNAGSIDEVNAFLQNRVQQAFEKGGSAWVSVSASAPVYSTSTLLIGPSAK